MPLHYTITTGQRPSTITPIVCGTPNRIMVLSPRAIHDSSEDLPPLSRTRRQPLYTQT
ncbi:Hypothetical predicted protein, partial [Pelobates cultripes]